MGEKQKLHKLNIVEIMTGDEQAFDQPCVFANRVGHHAVYCHNAEWLDAPRKCPHWGWDEVPYEECEGFKPNSD